ncbi:MAG TPA: glycosyltransferase family 1 protein [Herpetosiphonaceae bacterium]
MRIGYLTYGLDRAPTGIGRYAVELLRALAALPGAPDIVMLTTEREDRHDLWSRFERHHVPGCRLLPALMTLGNAALSDAARRYRLDLLHDPNGIAPFFGPRAGARRVVTIHDAFAFVYPETHNRLDNWRYHAMLTRAARRADMVLTDSDHSRQDLKRYLAIPDANLRLIHCGLDPRFQPVGDDHERRAVLARYGIQPPYLLYVGGINARKNIARLLEAFARVRERHAALKLVIGGKRQWQTGAIDATFERLALHEHVQFTGYLADADLPALYSAAEVFVFPSLYEGFGLPPLEALACGTPVVTSNASSLPEVVGDAALTVDPYAVDALATAIQRALTDAALRADLRQRGLSRARQFTWQRAAREVFEVYQHVLGRALDGTMPEAVPADRQSIGS